MLMPNHTAAMYAYFVDLRKSLKRRQKEAHKANHGLRERIYGFLQRSIKKLVNFHYSRVCSAETRKYLSEIFPECTTGYPAEQQGVPPCK
jgi:hypothetical protein